MTDIHKKIILFIFINVECFAQSIFSGEVFDQEKKQPLQNVLVTISKINTSKSVAPLAYVFTNNLGKFELKILADHDSLQLNVRLLGYQSIKRNVINQSQVLQIELFHSNTELKEIRIKPDPIRKYGDTLSYNVSAFKSQEDRVIADIIKKLPGIEVKPDGQIFYQGEAINKYYIEGLDLLEGRYKLANDNLNVEAVTSVEIMENHQPIRMLDGQVFSEKAALNIKLKKSVATTGQAIAGAGLSPFLRDMNLTPMIFTKKNQALFTFQSNNTGRNIANQLKQLTPGFQLNDLSNNSKNDWLGIQKLNSPSFKDIRWLDNNCQIGSINILKSLNKGFEIRFQGDYVNDVQQQIGYTKSTFFNQDSDIELLENKVNKLYFNNLKTDLTLQKNTKEKFVKNSLQVKAFWDKQTGIIQNTNFTINQQLKNPYFTINNEYRNIIKLKKTLLTLQSSISFERLPQSLVVNPNQFEQLFNTENTIKQNLVQTGLQSNTYFQFTKNYKQLTWDFKTGFNIENQNLVTNIEINDDNTNLESEFSNQLDWLSQKYFFNIQHRLKKEKLSISLDTPLNQYIFNKKDIFLTKFNNLSKLVSEPNLRLNYEINNFWKLNYSSSYKYNFGGIEQMYFGYILTNYRTIQRNNTELFQSKTFQNILGLNYQNPTNSTFGGFNIRYSLRENNLLFASTIKPNATIEKNTIAQTNQNINQSVSGRIGKYFNKIKTNITMTSNLSEEKGVQLINNKLTDLSFKSINSSLKVITNISKWFNFDYSYKYSNFKNYIENTKKQTIISQNHEAKLNFFPTKNTYLGFNSELYLNNFNNQKNFFTDIILNKTVSKRKVDLELSWTNIFNSQAIVLINNGSFSYIETKYNLRPTQAVLKVRVPF